MKYWDKAWTLVDGCTSISEGCLNCWSRAMNNRFKRGNFSKVFPRYTNLGLPLKTRKPTVFAVWNDLFHEKANRYFIKRAFDIMVNCHKTNKGHTFLVLTKRASRMAHFVSSWIDYIPDNIYLGITAENQKRLEERLPYLLDIDAKKFISIEPMLSEIDLLGIKWIAEKFVRYPKDTTVHQIICGAETGHLARKTPFHAISNLRDQCLIAGVPFFLKQVNSKRDRILDGKEHNDLVWRNEIPTRT